MTRAALNGLILPTEANDHKPAVKSFCIRQRGARTGIRLISYRIIARISFCAHAEGVNSARCNREGRYHDNFKKILSPSWLKPALGFHLSTRHSRTETSGEPTPAVT